MIKTINVTGEMSVDLNTDGNNTYFSENKKYCRVDNKSSANVYVSLSPNISEGKDGVLEIPAGDSGILELSAANKIYVLGSGKIQIQTSSVPFNLSMRGGGSTNANGSNVVVDAKRSTAHVDDGWMILETGSSRLNPDYRIDCYDVSSLSQIYIKINDPECIFNWQTDSNVVTINPNPNLVGSPVISGKSGVYNVPEGATWVCFSVKKTDTVTGVYNFHADSNSESNSSNIVISQTIDSTSTNATVPTSKAVYNFVKGYTDKEIADLINGAPETLDTLGQIATAMQENHDVVEALDLAIGQKADKTDLTSLETAVNSELDKKLDKDNIPVASQTVLGGVKIDGTTITIDENGVISAVGGGSGGSNGDVQANFLTEDGYGNLRYYNGHFQYYNGTDWIDTSATPDNIYIMNLAPKAMKSITGVYDLALGRNKLKFEEPADTVLNGQVVCVVESIMIRRKLGSAPLNENDGVFVGEIHRRDFGVHKNEFYIDETFEPTFGEQWYYKALPMSTTGFFNTLDINTAVILCKEYELYGFKINQTESDPASMIAYIEDNKDFRSAYMDYTTDLFDYGDWKNAFFMQVKPCMLKYDGTVDYYLNPNDYSLKEDGTVSDIANANYDGNVMIQFPKIYWKIIDNGNDTANVYICSKKLDDDFHCWSHIDNNGNEIPYCYMPAYNGYDDGTRLRSLSGKTPIYSKTVSQEISLALANNSTSDIIWYTEVFSDRMLIDLLLLLIGKSTNTQFIFGNGYCFGGSQNSNPRMATGTMNVKGLFWGSNGSSMVGVKIFGMEHWWGNQWRRIAGWINDKGIQKIKMTYGQSDGSTVNGYNATGNGYIAIPNSTPNGTNGGYVSKMMFDTHCLIPKMGSGSATTYYTDGLWFDNSQVFYAISGGASTGGFLSGGLSLDMSTSASHPSWANGVAISCKPFANNGGTI